MKTQQHTKNATQSSLEKHKTKKPFDPFPAPDPSYAFGGDHLASAVEGSDLTSAIEYFDRLYSHFSQSPNLVGVAIISIDHESEFADRLMDCECLPLTKVVDYVAKHAPGQLPYLQNLASPPHEEGLYRALYVGDLGATWIQRSCGIRTNAQENVALSGSTQSLRPSPVHLAGPWYPPLKGVFLMSKRYVRRSQKNAQRSKKNTPKMHVRSHAATRPQDLMEVWEKTQGAASELLRKTPNLTPCHVCHVIDYDGVAATCTVHSPSKVRELLTLMTPEAAWKAQCLLSPPPFPNNLWVMLERNGGELMIFATQRIPKIPQQGAA